MMAKPITKHSTEPDDDWESRMEPWEVRWCWDQIEHEFAHYDFGSCIDNYRAARMWVSSQRRRFRRMRLKGCCGSHNFVAKRWNGRKLRFDLYLLGFNYGH